MTGPRNEPGFVSEVKRLWWGSDVNFRVVRSCNHERWIGRVIAVLLQDERVDFSKILPGPRPYYARRIGKRSFTATVKPTVHDNSSRRRSFAKNLLKPEESEKTGISFSCGHKTFSETKLLKNAVITIICDFLGNFSFKHKSKMTDHSCMVNFLQCSVDGKHLVSFLSLCGQSVRCLRCFATSFTKCVI